MKTKIVNLEYEEVPYDLLLKDHAVYSNEFVEDAVKGKKEVIKTLKGKEAREYLFRLALMLQKANNEISVKDPDFEKLINSELIDLIRCLKFVARLGGLQILKWEGEKAEVSDVLEISIDTRNGMPMMDEIDEEINKWRKMIDGSDDKAVEKFKERLMNHPEQMPEMHEYFALYMNHLTSKVGKLGYPPKYPTQKCIGIKYIYMELYGHNSLQFFYAGKIPTDKKGWGKKEIYTWKGTEQVWDKDILTVMSNRIINDATYLKKQMVELLQRVYGRHAKKMVTKTISMAFINKYTRNQDMIAIPDAPKEHLKEDCLVLRCHADNEEDIRLRYIIIYDDKKEKIKELDI